MSFVSVEQLDKSYGATSIFRDIDFAAARGEFVTLLGPSGCGKSTLLRCIAGLTEVDSGRILIDGEDVVPLPPQKRGIAMVFQSYALFPNMTVQQNVAFGLRMQKVPAAELKQRVAEPSNWWNWASTPHATRTSSPAASASGWRWPARW